MTVNHFNCKFVVQKKKREEETALVLPALVSPWLPLTRAELRLNSDLFVAGRVVLKRTSAIISVKWIRELRRGPVDAALPPERATVYHRDQSPRCLGCRGRLPAGRTRCPIKYTACLQIKHVSYWRLLLGYKSSVTWRRCSRNSPEREQ